MFLMNNATDCYAMSLVAIVIVGHDIQDGHEKMLPWLLTNRYIIIFK